MAGIYRAYGQIRRGSDPWRSPFLVPVADLVVAKWPSSFVSIDTGGPSPDLALGLKVLSADQFPNIAVQLDIQPVVSPPPSDITVRVVLLMDGESQLINSLPIGSAAQFAVMEHTTAAGETFPTRFSVNVALTNLNTDSEAVTVASPGLAPPFPPGKITVQRVALDIRDTRMLPGGAPGPGAPIHLRGGIVSGTVVGIPGVETNHIDGTPLTAYSEAARTIHGIDLAWIDGAGALPPSAMMLDADVTGSTSSPSRFAVDIDTPVTQDAPVGAPGVAPLTGGTLREGSYRYCFTWVHQNGCESSPSDRSGPIDVSGSTRGVRVSGLPAAPATPSPDPTGLRVVGRRIYRTDPDSSSPGTDPERGGAGDDVLVAELAPTDTIFDDLGPADPDDPPQLRTDYLSIGYSAPVSLDITGSIRMISGGPAPSEETYRGSVTAGPTALRVVHKPGRDPRLLFVADGATDALTVEMPDMDTAFGAGLSASVNDLPDKFALDWAILGSEFFGLGAAGDSAAGVPVGADGSLPIGRVGVRLGQPSPAGSLPASWPAGEADVAVELSDASTGSPPSSLFSMAGLRRGSVRSGARRWSQRDADEGVIEFTADFAEGAPASDRTLRIARRAGGEDSFPHLAVDAHFLPEHVHGIARLPAGGDASVTLDTRVRFLRAAFAAMTGTPPDSGLLEGLVFLDDTTETLEAKLGAAPTVTTKWPVRVAGTIRTRADASSRPEMTVWPDVLVPDEVTVTTDWPIRSTLSEPGLSGRVAVGWGDTAPLAVRATPQAKFLLHGSAEGETGLRTVTGRVLSLADVDLPKSVTMFGDEAATGQVDVEPEVRFHPRANTSLRGEVIEREQRVSADGTDLRAPVGCRSWLRARTAHVPTRLTPLVRLVDGSPVGAEAVTSEAWGEGVVWAEPSYVWEPPACAAPGAAADLSEDQGIGLVTAGWAGIPDRVEVWDLGGGSGLDGRVADADRLPDIGPATSSWVPGGVLLRVNGELRISGLQVALRTGTSRVCWNDNSSGGFGTGVILMPDTPVRHGNWIKAAAAFVDLVPSAAGTEDIVVWMAKEFAAAGTPCDAANPEANPCTDSGDGADGPESALGWRIHDDMRMRVALKYFDLVTPSGPLDPAPRWWAMPTSSERWAGDDVDAGEWELRYEVQMDDYGAAKLAVYPDLSANPFASPDVLDNPFGDPDDANGDFWLRARSVGGGPFHLDVYLGNVGGGTSIPFSNALYSSLPRIFNWSYP